MTSLTINNSGDGSFENPFKKLQCGRNINKRIKNSYYFNKKGEIRYWNGTKLRRQTTDIFIHRSKQINGNKFNYSLVNYKQNYLHVILICNDCGYKFSQRPDMHISQKQGCQKCGYKKVADSNRKGIKKFIEEAKKIHGDKYDYSLVNYINTHTKVKIICPIHGEFEQNAGDHVGGNGCKKCGYKISAEKQKLTYEKFIEKAIKFHGDKYDYSLVNYINSKTNVKIKCPIHGEFLQQPGHHMRGVGCDKCFRDTIKDKLGYTKEIFIEKAKKTHGDIYDYSLVNYVDSLTKVKILCSTHGEFSQAPSKHLQRRGCPNCLNKTEGKLFSWLLELYPMLVTSQYSPSWIERLRYDFLIKDIKLIIELDGEQHFKYISCWHDNENSYIEQQDSDVYKMKKANEKGYSVIRLLTKDVREDKNNWENILFAAIKSYDTPTNIFICSNNEYEHHKRLLYSNTSL